MNSIENNILETAIRLFKDNGYDNTSINSICDACGITKGTFYYHFNSKSELIFHYYEYVFGNMMSIMPEIIIMKEAKKKLWKLYEYSIDNTTSLGPSLLHAMIIADAQNGLAYFSPINAGSISNSRQINVKIMKELVIQAQNEGTISKDKNPDLLIQAFNSIIIALALDWSSSTNRYDQKEKLKEMFDTIFI